jgi:hypothetical protein
VGASSSAITGVTVLQAKEPASTVTLARARDSNHPLGITRSPLQQGIVRDFVTSGEIS